MKQAEIVGNSIIINGDVLLKEDGFYDSKTMKFLIPYYPGKDLEINGTIAFEDASKWKKQPIPIFKSITINSDSTLSLDLNNAINVGRLYRDEEDIKQRWNKRKMKRNLEEIFT